MDDGKSWKELTDGQVIVAMIPYRDRIVVATADNIWLIRDGKAEIMKLTERSDG